MVTAQPSSNVNNLDPLVQGLAGNVSQHNTSFHNLSVGHNKSHLNLSSMDNSGILPKNFEQTLLNLEYYFWYILNNPCCYNEITFRWFDKSQRFCMFPHVEAFLKVYRLTGRAMNAPPPSVNMFRGIAGS